MFIIKSFTWWYTHGWSVFIGKVKSLLSTITDFFSMNSLIRTLFKPFRQISADTAAANSSIDLRIHMFFDRLISRIIGFFSRFFLLLTGSIITIFTVAISFVLVVIWPLVPLMPIAGIILTLTGVTL